MRRDKSNFPPSFPPFNFITTVQTGVPVHVAPSIMPGHCLHPSHALHFTQFPFCSPSFVPPLCLFAVATSIVRHTCGGSDCCPDQRTHLRYGHAPLYFAACVVRLQGVWVWLLLLGNSPFPFPAFRVPFKHSFPFGLLVQTTVPLYGSDSLATVPLIPLRTFRCLIPPIRRTIPPAIFVVFSHQPRWIALHPPQP